MVGCERRVQNSDPGLQVTWSLTRRYIAAITFGQARRYLLRRYYYVLYQLGLEQLIRQNTTRNNTEGNRGPDRK